LELRHLPLCGRPVILRLRPKRYRCRYCEGVVTTPERAEWYDAKAGCTKAYAEFLLLELVNGTLQDVAKKHGVTYDVVRGVLKRYVKGEVDWRQFKVLRILGVDEISLLKGHSDFVTLVGAQDEPGNPIVLAVLKGREKKTRVDFLKTIPRRLQATIKEVCTDLYDSFIDAVEEVLPQATIVADRFPVAKLYRAAVDAVRKTELKALKEVLTKEQYAGLKGSPIPGEKHPICFHQQLTPVATTKRTSTPAEKFVYTVGGRTNDHPAVAQCHARWVVTILPRNLYDQSLLHLLY
jgi:transposase